MKTERKSQTYYSRRSLKMTTEVNPKNVWVSEAKLYKKLKQNTPSNYLDIGLKILAYSVLPDVLGYNSSGHFFTVELKVSPS